jgi:hypothetical protein
MLQVMKDFNKLDTLISVITFRLYIILSSFRNLVYQLESLFTSCNGQRWLGDVRKAPKVPSKPDVGVVSTLFQGQVACRLQSRRGHYS